jgi:hypothetical protein
MESEPGAELREVWAYLTPAEAAELLMALEDRANDPSPDPDWHTHVTDEAGRELTIAIDGGQAPRHSHDS